MKNAQLSTGDSSSPSPRRPSEQQPDDALDEKPEHSDNDDTDHIIPEHMLIAGGLPVKVELEEGDYNRVQNTDSGDRVQITPQHSVPVKQEGSLDHQPAQDGSSEGQTGLPVKAEDMKESGWMCEQQGLAEQLLVKMEEEEGGKHWLG
jgi:hypothetical protein